jgi:hypothetical protein
MRGCVCWWWTEGKVTRGNGGSVPTRVTPIATVTAGLLLATARDEL